MKAVLWGTRGSLGSASAETVVAPPQASPAQRTGWLVPAHDAGALAAAIAEALDLRSAARDAAHPLRVPYRRHTVAGP